MTGKTEKGVDDMPDGDIPVQAVPRVTISGVIGNTIIACLLTFAVTRLGISQEWQARGILLSAIAVFFLVIHTDPMGRLRARPLLCDMGAKLALGFGLAAGVTLIVSGALNPEPVAGVAEAAVALVTRLWPLLLLTPLLLFAPFLGGAAFRPAGPRREAAIAGPVAPLVQLGLMLAIVAVLWLSGMKPLWALGLGGLGLALAMVETWAARSMPRAEDVSTGARLRSAIPAMSASALFIGSSAYVAVHVVLPVLDAPAMFEATPEEVLMPLLIGAGAVLGLVLATSALAIVVLGTIAVTFDHGPDPDRTTLPDLLGQGAARLFAAGPSRRHGD